MHGKSSSLKAELGSPAASRFPMRRGLRREVSRVGVGRAVPSLWPLIPQFRLITFDSVNRVRFSLGGRYAVLFAPPLGRPTPTLDTSDRHTRRMRNLDAAGLPNSAFRLLDFPCIVARLHGLRRTIYRDDAACRSRGGNNSGARLGGVSGSS